MWSLIRIGEVALGSSASVLEVLCLIFWPICGQATPIKCRGSSIAEGEPLSGTNSLYKCCVAKPAHSKLPGEDRKLDDWISAAAAMQLFRC